MRSSWTGGKQPNHKQTRPDQLARIAAALGMTVEDLYTQNRRLWLRLREKSGKRHVMPCHHNLEE